jgi:hypothetical protein
MRIKNSVLVLAIAMIAMPVLAASGISAKYDGKYQGTASVNSATSSTSCSSYRLDDVSIEQGALSSANPDLAVKGFITEEGFLDASVTPAGGNTAELDGRLEDGAIVAGAIDPATGCSWIVKLEKVP